MPDSPNETAIGLAGIGGYSMYAHLLDNAPLATPPLKLAAACDPAWRNFPDRVARLRAAGAEVFDDFDALLARRDVIGLWLALPIDLHRPLTQRALAAGKRVMCEKPAAGCIEDVDAMIAAEQHAGLPVLIGFQDVYDPVTAQLKRSLVDGAIGRVTHATLHACWPRGSVYFGRNTWAGRFSRNGTWVLDSPANNAMAHFINVAMLLLGPTFHESAAPVEVEAELYRAARIESYDTISARATLDTGASLLMLLTHACTRNVDPVLRLHGERGWAEYTQTGCRIVTTDEDRMIPRDIKTLRRPMIDAWARALVGTTRPDELVATLAMARLHTLLICGISEAAAVYDVPSAATSVTTSERGGDIHAIPGIEDAFARCTAENRLLQQMGLYSFTREPGKFNLRGYNRFTGGRTAAAPGS